MLKKSGIILVTLLYLVTATGFALNLHFCAENLASVNINEVAKDCGMSSKCCKTTHLEVKVKDAHQTTHTVFSPVNLALPVALVQFNLLAELQFTTQLPSFLTEGGPPPGKVSLLIKNCTFRI